MLLADRSQVSLTGMGNCWQRFQVMPRRRYRRLWFILLLIVLTYAGGYVMYLQDPANVARQEVSENLGWQIDVPEKNIADAALHAMYQPLLRLHRRHWPEGFLQLPDGTESLRTVLSAEQVLQHHSDQRLPPLPDFVDTFGFVDNLPGRSTVPRFFFRVPKSYWDQFLSYLDQLAVSKGEPGAPPPLELVKEGPLGRVGWIFGFRFPSDATVLVFETSAEVPAVYEILIWIDPGSRFVLVSHFK